MLVLELSNAKAEQKYEKELNLKVISIANQRKGYLVLKRLLDIVFSLMGLIVLLPVFIVIAFLIKIEDQKGPVLFKQIRVGKNNEEFTMYKFRSMVSNAEDLLEDLLDKNETTGAMFKMRDDPRITKIGKFIRRTSLDELPQLLNVLKGEMSLVGPRPPLPREVEKYNDYHKQRLLAKPGCTGLWQVSGRSSIGFDEMVQLDLKYITKSNTFYDLCIILKTVKILFVSDDAY
ncbi:sugar transferase [Priestia aryabhattai]|uniref:Sugar transferase n=1 Tax=Priestia aryabhattai TaxID=412384 RepID=A0ABD5KRZ3_PRIAR|nr:sugar transferase [Priestia aryabhattai]MBY0006615.1 sugar transferase [Priestia aryabhattai]MBY0047279.1 sugar transferase [Priestia aryabhattai]